MPTEEFEQLKEVLKKPATPEAMSEAAEAFRRYEAAHPTKSKPTLVSLGLKKTYPNAVPVDRIPDELGKNPEFYNLVKRVITKEK